MRRILLVLPLALLLAAGGAAFLYLGGAGSADAAVEDDRPLAVVPPGTIVALRTITLPVLRDGRTERRVAFTMLVEVAPNGDHRRILEMMPRIEDAIITELSMLMALNWPGDVAVDLDVARARLLERARRVDGQGNVGRVLFQAVQELRS
ncbi:MAG: hypothetical protein ACK4QW_05405 [Alphaproteobacteria bacterium]